MAPNTVDPPLASTPPILPLRRINHLFLLITLLIFLPIQKILYKNPRIQHQRPKAAQQPAQIHRNIFPIQRPRLAVPTVPLVTDRLVRHDTEHVREVPDTSKEEEEHGNAVGGFAAVVEQELRNAGPEVQRGADVAEDLAPEVEGERVWFGVCGFLRGVAGGEVPAKDARGADEDYDAEVVEHGLEGGGGFGAGLAGGGA
jgi:hypothetical protein